VSDYSVSVYTRTGSPYWWARCYLAGEGGKKRRWSTGIRLDADGGKRKSRRLAQARADEQGRRLADSLDLQRTTGSDTSLKAVARRMLRQKLADNRRPRAVAALGHNLDKHVLPFFGAGRDVRTLRRADLEALKAKLSEAGKAPVTINNCLTAIRQVLKHAHSVDELLESVPEVRNVVVPSDSQGRALTAEEVSSLLEAVDPRAGEARQYLAFVANTGMRKAETLAMRWGWIDWERAELRIPAEYRKGGKRGARVPLPPAAVEILRDRQEHGTRYTGSSKRPLPTGPGDRVWLQIKHDVARNSAAERAGLGRVRTHDLRHTKGSLAWAAGASLPEVRDLLGHRTLAMVSRYAHSYEERLHEVSGRVQFSVPGSVPTERPDVPGKGLVPAQPRRRRAR
jgi:integrase